MSLDAEEKGVRTLPSSHIYRTVQYWCFLIVQINKVFAVIWPWTISMKRTSQGRLKHSLSSCVLLVDEGWELCVLESWDKELVTPGRGF